MRASAAVSTEVVIRESSTVGWRRSVTVGAALGVLSQPRLWSTSSYFQWPLRELWRPKPTEIGFRIGGPPSRASFRLSGER